ncbi:hypothetical protein RV15_GL001032 [Enterococcus silesiacus]|uniref:Uncharacterized protein n=1 Tax=Enterococcus silesiacus TaxID=332949 RepID=A0AA91JNK7_9ENTE|nr:hypothetical protein RV15_GL001032 [Enterococcus silesiacus]
MPKKSILYWSIKVNLKALKNDLGGGLNVSLENVSNGY